jgi:hypothetical protein
MLKKESKVGKRGVKLITNQIQFIFMRILKIGLKLVTIVIVFIYGYVLGYSSRELHDEHKKYDKRIARESNDKFKETD